MSTYRERRERRAERLREWSEKRDASSRAAQQTSSEMLDRIPFGQPILVGHHSEKADRRYRGRAHGLMDRAVADGRKAEEMAGRADEIERQAAAAIYDDDPDAIERLTEKLAALEARRDAIKTQRAEIRKAHREQLKGLSAWEREEVMRAAGAAQYSVANLTGNIGRTRDRLARLKREKEHGPRDRLITARFASSCETCGAQLERGALIRYNRQQGARCATSCGEEQDGAGNDIRAAERL